MIEENEPTGRIRYRVLHRWFRNPLMILQIEISGRNIYPCGPSIEIEHITFWRDARPQDILIG